MSAVGGSIESVNLSGRNFPVPADADSQRKIGGWENEVQANGDGTGRLIKTRVPFSLADLTIEIDDSRGDHEYLQALQNRPDFWPMSITYASGATWQGTAQITGEVTVSSTNSTASISLSGPGTVTQQ